MNTKRAALRLGAGRRSVRGGLGRHLEVDPNRHFDPIPG